MINTQMTRQTFKKITVDDNKYCYECGTTTPSWATLPYGIFLCYNCSGIHRGMGPQISFVRSIEMDSWSEKQLTMMMLGGNKALRSFFESHGIAHENQNKYKTKAAYYYREKMRALANETEMPAEPDIWTEIYEGTQVRIQSQDSQSQQQQSLGNQVHKFVNQTQESALGTIHQIDDIFNTSSVSREIKNFGTDIQNKTKQFGVKTINYCQEKSTKIIAKTYEGVKKGLDDVIGYLKPKIQDPITSNNQQSQSQMPQQQTITNQNQQEQKNSQNNLKVTFDFLSDFPNQPVQQPISNQQIQPDLINYEEYFTDGPTSEIIYVQKNQTLQQQNNTQEFNLMDFREQLPNDQLQQQQNHDLLDL